MENEKQTTKQTNKQPETLLLIQSELKVPKGNYNGFGKFKYRSASDILEALKPLLLKHNVILTLTDEIVMIGTKIFLKATAKLGDHVSYGFAETDAHKGMSAEQTTGTASSYARKYALNGLFLIDETESDPDAVHQQDKNKAPIDAPAPAQPQTPLIPAKKQLFKFINMQTGELSKEWINVVSALESGKADIEKVKSVYIIPVHQQSELASITVKKS